MTATTTERAPKRTVHTHLAEQRAAQEARAQAPVSKGAFRRVAEQCRCINRDCVSPGIRAGSDCFMFLDGSVECAECHPPGRPAVVEVVDRECKVCGSRFQFMGEDDDDSTGLTCGRKCRRTLDRRNSKSANRADQD